MLSGTPLARLPKLRRLAAGLKFIPIVERSAERSHAVVSKSLRRGTLHTEPYVSLALRSGEIRDLLQDPVRLVALAWHVELVRSRAWCLRRLGHERHYALKERLQDSGELMGATGRHGQELSQALACAVIYHTDLSTQFMTHQTLFDDMEDSKCRGRTQEVITFGGALSFLEQKYGTDHFRIHADVQSFYSTRVKTGSSTSSETMHTIAELCDAVCGPGGAFDIGCDGGSFQSVNTSGTAKSRVETHTFLCFWTRIRRI